MRAYIDCLPVKARLLLSKVLSLSLINIYHHNIYNPSSNQKEEVGIVLFPISL